jgi:hypothetical protein
MVWDQHVSSGEAALEAPACELGEEAFDGVEMPKSERSGMSSGDGGTFGRLWVTQRHRAGGGWHCAMNMFCRAQRELDSTIERDDAR